MFTGLDSPLHLLVILALALLLFGSKRLPEVGRSLGLGLREFKTSLTGEGVEASEPTPAVAAMTERDELDKGEEA